MSSKIIIICREDADPNANRLLLNTKKLMEIAPGLKVPAHIQLKPGRNVLEVSQYPDLKYGFYNEGVDESVCQIDRPIEEYDDDLTSWMGWSTDNCQDIVEIDLRQFDGSSMETMNNMFNRMGRLEHIYLNGLDTSNVKSMRYTFCGVGADVEKKTSSSEQNKTQEQSERETGYFIKDGIHNYILSNLNVENVEDFTNMFGMDGDGMTNLFRLSFDNWRLNHKSNVDEMFDGIESLVSMSLSGCDAYTIHTLKDAWNVPPIKIELTEEAKIWRDTHIEITVPETAEECFNGMGSIVGCNAPNLNNGVADIDRLIQPIKDSLRERIEELTQDYPKYDTALNVNFQEIISNVQVLLITKEDSIHQTILPPFRNYFKWKSNGLIDCVEYNTPAPPVPKDLPEDGNIDKDYRLGVYLPEYGAICLWVDRIMKSVNPEVVFQKVLLHEMIHALFDIQPRVYEQDSNGEWTIKALGCKYDTNLEETLDNTLVLRGYFDHLKSYRIVNYFIENLQKPPYSKAIDVFAQGSNEYKGKIQNLLISKLSSNEVPYSPDDLYYVIDGNDIDNNPDAEWSQLENIYNNFSDAFDLTEKEFKDAKLESVQSNLRTIVMNLKTPGEIGSHSIARFVITQDSSNPDRFCYFCAIEPLLIYYWSNEIEILYDFKSKQVIKRGILPKEISKKIVGLVKWINPNTSW